MFRPDPTSFQKPDPDPKPCYKGPPAMKALTFFITYPTTRSLFYCLKCAKQLHECTFFIYALIKPIKPKF